MLKAGFSRVDVTPPLGTYMSGYFYERKAEGIDDPIYLNAIALGNDDNKVVIIGADILSVGLTYADEIRELISEKTGLCKDNIMICALHQHTSIKIDKTNLGTVVEDKKYMDVLYRKFADVALMAINDMKEASASVATRETDEKIAFIRRYIMKDGKIETNPIGRYLEVDRPYRDADNNVRIIRFKRKEGNDIAFVNFSTHADVVHTSRFSADWCGFARKYVENDLENVSCILTVGAQGDSNHCDFTIPQYKDGYEHCKQMGRVVADTVIKIWDKTKPVNTDKISSNYEVVYNKTRTDGEELYEESLAFLADENNNPNNNTADITALAKATRIVRLRNETIYQKIPVTVINIGDIGFVGFGGEPFTRYADSLREALPDRYIISSCCTNGSAGYLPTKEAFSEGGYEASSSRFTPTIEEECVLAAIKLLNK